MSPEADRPTRAQVPQNQSSLAEKQPALGGLALTAPAFQLQASTTATGVVQRNVNPTTTNRLNRAAIFGTSSATSMTLEAFEAYSRRQADWFVETSLTATDRSNLWELLNKVALQPQFMSGAADLHIGDLIALMPTTNLDAYCRGTHGGTIRLFGISGVSLADRLARGAALLRMEALIPGPVLEVTMSEDQLLDLIANPALFTQVEDYWRTWRPHLQRNFSPASGARGPEFENVLNLLRAGPLTPFATLQGRVRNLHRFSVPMLTKLVANYADTTRRRGLQVVLHTGSDDSAFQLSANLFADLVTNSRNNVLFLEGLDSLATMTAMIPTLAATYGQRDRRGRHTIDQVMIAGHGQARSAELAGTGTPSVSGGSVHHHTESLDLDNNLGPTRDLLDAIFQNMDPATARLVYAGCLVGANRVPDGTPTAGIPAHIAANPSLATFTEQRARAAGHRSGRVVSAARASVGLSAASGLMDSRGNLGVQYGFDQAAFGSARGYVPVGSEPEGVLVAAVEVAASQNTVVAENLLRQRLRAGVQNGWWGECVIAFVNLALQGVSRGRGIDIAHVNSLAHAVQIPFLTRWPPSYGITVGHLVSVLQGKTYAQDAFREIVATNTYQNDTDNDALAQKLIVEQAWIQLGGSRVTNLTALLDTHNATLRSNFILRFLDTGALTGQAGTIFSTSAAATPGRLALALAWIQQDPTNAHARAYLDREVSNVGGTPTLSAPLQAQLAGITARQVLQTLGRLTASTTTVGAGGATVTLPDGNINVTGGPNNLNRVDPHPYRAIVINAMGAQPFTYTAPSWRTTPSLLPFGSQVQVFGFYGTNYAAIDLNGSTAIVEKDKISAP